MSLDQYLSESSVPRISLSDLSGETKQIVESITKNCRPFLREMKGSSTPFYRGTDKLGNKEFGEFTPRSDRNPLDTNPGVQKDLDKEFQRQFGWKPRSQGMFATRDKFSAQIYGDICIFIPIGNFSYLWSPYIWDMREITSRLENLNTIITYWPPRKGDWGVKDFLRSYIKYLMESWSTFIKSNLNDFMMDLMTKYYTLEPSLPKNAKKEDIVKLYNKSIEIFVNSYRDKNIKTTRGQEVMFQCRSYYLVLSQTKLGFVLSLGATQQPKKVEIDNVVSRLMKTGGKL